jgi:hypothetical protein
MKNIPFLRSKNLPAAVVGVVRSHDHAEGQVDAVRQIKLLLAEVKGEKIPRDVVAVILESVELKARMRMTGRL